MFKVLGWLIQASIFIAIGVAVGTWGHWGDETVSDRLRSLSEDSGLGEVSADLGERAREWVRESQEDLRHETEPLKREIDARAAKAERIRAREQKRLGELVRDLAPGARSAEERDKKGVARKNADDTDE